MVNSGFWIKCAKNDLYFSANKFQSYDACWEYLLAAEPDKPEREVYVKFYVVRIPPKTDFDIMPLKFGGEPPNS